MQLPDSVQNILAYGQGYKDGMKDGHICGFHDALVCAVHDLTALLKKYAELEKEYVGLQEKARRERMENMPQFEQTAEQKRGRWDEIQCFSEHGIEMASYECTSCGNDIERQRGLVPPYCEFCGAKMDGGAG